MLGHCKTTGRKNAENDERKKGTAPVSAFCQRERVKTQKTKRQQH